MIRTFDKRYRGEHPMFDTSDPPEEMAYCEECGATLEFCDCGVPLDYLTDEEREEA